MGTYYLDEDGDGFGVTENSITSCTLPEGYVVDDGDCNDDISPSTPMQKSPATRSTMTATERLTRKG